MKTEDFNYKLPKELIAQTPANPRDSSRLLVLKLDKNRTSSRGDAQTKHHTFYDIIDYLKTGDVLVMNNSKVFPARLIGQKEVTKGTVEILLNYEIESGLWECLGKNLKVGNRIKFKESKLSAVVIEKNNDVYQVRFNMSGNSLFSEIEKIGLTPLPPYIKRTEERKNLRTKELDKNSYQTVYAKELGSVAAPTAGLHFTTELLKKIRAKGVKIEFVTLHVGLGTFAPVKTNIIEKHRIHKEYYSIEENALNNIIKAKNENRRVIAVGTTTVRTLETMFDKLQNPNYKYQINSKDQNDSGHPALDAGSTNSRFPIKSGMTDNPNEARQLLSGWTNIFICPGYQFKCVDAMVTNFHLPKSSLIMLVSAFAGKKNIDQAYKVAIERKYRFYSYGDAMLIINYVGIDRETSKSYNTKVIPVSGRY